MGATLILSLKLWLTPQPCSMRLQLWLTPQPRSTGSTLLLRITCITECAYACHHKGQQALQDAQASSLVQVPVCFFVQQPTR